MQREGNTESGRDRAGERERERERETNEAAGPWVRRGLSHYLSSSLVGRTSSILSVAVDGVLSAAGAGERQAREIEREKEGLIVRETSEMRGA
jgi:hypothetical protein